MAKTTLGFVALVLVALVVTACDITQEHIDDASERLANATVAVGHPPSQSQASAGENLRTAHVAGSSWRIVEVEAWPHAMAVVTLGSNGRAVWHVGESRFLQWHHWRVTYRWPLAVRGGLWLAEDEWGDGGPAT